MERDKRKKSKMPCLFGGNGENLNRKIGQPRSPSDRITEHNLFPFEVGQTSSKQGYYGTPMKTLLAKEMLNEKKRSPSLIAKLMGLDGFPSPSPQPIHKPQRKLSDNSHKPKRTADKKTTTEQQQFKDVYIDPEASHAGNQHAIAKRRSTKQELGYIQERCDQMLRESIAIKSKLERVDSNSDLMLSFLQKPDSLFVKHLHDQQTESLCNQITVLKPSNSKQGQKQTYVSHQRNNSRRFERKDDIVISPTKIVVLKPNLAKIYNDKSSFHSPDGGPGPLGEVRSSRYKSREAREIARQITSQMKEGFECGNINLFHSGYRGYAGDENESERTAVTSRSRSRRSPSNTSESSLIREAKKRMSQRWKTHGYKDVGIIGKGNTLEEMLSVPKNDHEYLRNTSRSRSVPPSFRNPSHDYHESIADEKIVVYNEPIHRGKNKGVKGNFNHREDLRSKNLRYDKKYRSSQQCSPEFDNILRERPSIRKIKNEDPALESLISNVHDGFRIYSESSNELVTCMLRDEDSLNSQEPGASVSVQLSGPEPESSEGSKEVNQCVQISVVEGSPTEDVSSHSSGSDCFEKVSSQLHELRKQLHLLKMESRSTTSDDEEVDQQQPPPSFLLSDPENWESTYLTDFLQSSGFYDSHDHDPYTFMTSDLPVWLFDHLEKKYSEGSVVSRSERRLFYDRISEALVVICESWVLSCWWVRRGIGFEDELRKVVSKQEKEVAASEEEFEEMCVDKDGEWVVAVKEIDVVGKEIAEMLVDELLLEIV